MPKRTARYDEHLGRFVLGVEYADPVMFDVKRIEGRRFHGGVKYWSVPASLRVWKKLQALDFEMLQYGGMPGYVSWLERGCPVNGVEAPYDLFPYQREGVARLLTRKKMILADEPGLGKTWQAIEWARRKRHRKLIVAPKVVLSQWRDAVYKRCGDDVPSVRVRAPVWGVGEWNIVNYEFLPKLERVAGDFDLIVDEAHLCANTKSQRTKAILRIAGTSSRCLLLTGTPPAKPNRLWPFFLACGERDAKEFFPFALRYCGAERNDFGWDFGGATHLDELRDELQHFMLRRTKEQVLPDLPPLIISPLRVDAETSKVSEQNAIRKADDEIFSLVERGHSLFGEEGIGAVQRLRVLTSKQKLETTSEYIKALGPTRVVVFCQFRETMDALEKALLDWPKGTSIEDTPHVLQINGDTPDEVRKGVVQLLQWHPWLVAILQAGVGGTGLDGLQAANVGVIHDLPWTKDDMDQIVSRLHRQGQEHDSVNIVPVISTSAIEQKMEQAIREGRELHEVMYGN